MLFAKRKKTGVASDATPAEENIKSLQPIHTAVATVAGRGENRLTSTTLTRLTPRL